MAIPGKKISLDLNKAEPTQLTPESLKKQLADIGLTCKDAAVGSLKEYIAEVKSQLPRGVTQSFGINGPKPSESGALVYKSEFDLAAAPYTGLSQTSIGDWEPSGSALGYSADLEYVQFPSHFDYMYGNREKLGFTGVVSNPPPYTGKYDNVSAVKSLFVNVGITASSILVKGLDVSSIESILSNAIAPLTEANAQDYEVTDSRVIFLVDNYDPVKNEADAIGVLGINWHLQIKDYKEKKDTPKHDTTLTITARAVTYDSIDTLKKNVADIKAHFKANAFMMAAIPGRNSVEIYTDKPPATADTFANSLPTLAKADYSDVIVLFAPNLIGMGSIDNTKSPAESRYSKSVTSGFTFTASQTLSAEAYFEASAEVVKVGFKVGLSLTFTEQWNKSTTETIEFVVPAGKKAFNYQGTLVAATLRFDAASGGYSYQSTAKFLTNTLVTSETPLVDS
jgi:hypothetical protein